MNKELEEYLIPPIFELRNHYYYWDSFFPIGMLNATGNLLIVLALLSTASLFIKQENVTMAETNPSEQEKIIEDVENLHTAYQQDGVRRKIREHRRRNFNKLEELSAENYIIH